MPARLVTGKDLLFLLFTGKWEAYPEGGARINGIDKCATIGPTMGLPCHAKVARACAALQSKAKNFIRFPSPSREEAGGSEPLRTRTRPRDSMQPLRANLAREQKFGL